MRKNLRVVTWNCRHAARGSAVWDYFLELAPDIALLQEVTSIPSCVLDEFAHFEQCPIYKTGSPQRFNTVLLTRGRIGNEVRLSGPAPWVDVELDRFKGNLVARELFPDNGPKMNAISVYSPAWPVNRDRLAGLDISGVKLTQNPDVWIADLLWASLNHRKPDPGEAWIIGGDFNLSETFDLWPGGPRGNREYLDKMIALGLVECLRHAKGELTPTFRNTMGKAVKHQMDHLFITRVLADRLVACDTGSQERVFGMGLSDHLPIVAEFSMINESDVN